MVSGRRGKVLQYDWVSLLTQRGQVTDVQLQFAAILIEIQERRENLQEGKYKTALVRFINNVNKINACMNAHWSILDSGRFSSLFERDHLCYWPWRLLPARELTYLSTRTQGC